MDFVCGLPRSRKGHEAMCVVVKRLTKNADFLAMNMTDSLKKMSKLYLQEIVRLHGFPKSIVSEWDPRSHQDSGRDFRRHWARNCTSVPQITLRRMVNPKEPFRS